MAFFKQIHARFAGVFLASVEGWPFVSKLKIHNAFEGQFPSKSSIYGLQCELHDQTGGFSPPVFFGRYIV
jgi:hypothetical protein